MSRVELYDHQKEALAKLKNGSILCGGVGSGKSITALAYYYQQCGARYYDDHPHLVVPKDLYIITTAQKRDKLEWDREAAYFLLSTNQDVSIQNIKLTIDSWNNIKRYIDVKDAFFIFDEQKVVGYGTWAKSFIKIAKNNEWILCSATPGDVWSDYIPVFIANGFYPNKTQFLRRHAVYNRYSKYPKIDRWLEQGHLMKLRQSILVNMPYRKPTERHVVRRLAEYDEDLMKRIVENRWNEFESKPIRNISEVCYLARKVANAHLSRLDAIKDILKTKNRVIIFYNFDYELEILRTLSELPGFEIAEWNGHKHEYIPDSEKWIYLVNYAAGAEGWNCVSTDTIIFYSLNYSYKIMEQAAGRIDRLNTPFKDLYYYLFASNSKIDKAILRALRNKKNFNERDFE